MTRLTRLLTRLRGAWQLYVWVLGFVTDGRSYRRTGWR